MTANIVFVRRNTEIRMIPYTSKTLFFSFQESFGKQQR